MISFHVVECCLLDTRIPIHILFFPVLSKNPCWPLRRFDWGSIAISLSDGKLLEKALDWRRDPGTLTPKIYLIDIDRGKTFPEDFLRDMITIWTNLVKDNMWIVLSSLDTFRDNLISEKKLLKLRLVKKADITGGIEVTKMNVSAIETNVLRHYFQNFNIKALACRILRWNTAYFKDSDFKAMMTIFSIQLSCAYFSHSYGNDQLYTGYAVYNEVFHFCLYLISVAFYNPPSHSRIFT